MRASLPHALLAEDNLYSAKIGDMIDWEALGRELFFDPRLSGSISPRSRPANSS